MTEFEIVLSDSSANLPTSIANFEELKAMLTEKLEFYRSLAVTADTIAAAKADRAKLNKLKTAIDNQRKEVKKRAAAMIEPLEKQYKEIIALIDEPVGMIDSQLKALEDGEKEAKYQALADFFGGLDAPEWVTLDEIINPKWGNKSEKLDKLKEEISERVEEIRSDYNTLAERFTERPFWVAVELRYRETKDFSKTLVYAVELEDQQKRTAEAVKPDDSIVTPESEENVVEDVADVSEAILTGTFEVSGTILQIKALGEYMRANGITYRVINR